VTEELRDEVIVLGCGSSILELSDDDRSHINSCKYRIAINKFAAFHELAGIRPTHVFFIDSYDESCKNWLQYIFSKAISDGLENLTFVVSKDIEKSLRRCTTEDAQFLSDHGYFQELRSSPFGWRNVLDDSAATFLIPQRCKIEFVSHADWLLGGAWARSLNEPLFHYRGGLTSLLNYIAICFPGKCVRLVGTDFYSGSPFFESQLQEIQFPWQDWTTRIAKRQDKHFSAIEHKGSTMFDRFPLVVDNLFRSGNVISCVNSKSLLVQHALVASVPLTAATTQHPAESYSSVDIWDALVRQISVAIARDSDTAELIMKAESAVDEMRNSLSWKFGHAIFSVLGWFFPWRSRPEILNTPSHHPVDE
jgi:hypothetical protein